MPYINSVSEQMLMDGPDGLESDALEDRKERFWPRNRNPGSSSTRTTRKGERRNFPTVSASIPPLLLLQQILQEMPALKCSLISGFTRSEWSWCRPAAALQTLRSARLRGWFSYGSGRLSTNQPCHLVSQFLFPSS